MKKTSIFTILGLAAAFAVTPAQAAIIDTAPAQLSSIEGSAIGINIVDVGELEGISELKRSNRSFRSGRGLRNRGFRGRGFQGRHFGHHRSFKRHKAYKYQSFRHGRSKHSGFGRRHIGRRGY